MAAPESSVAWRARQFGIIFAIWTVFGLLVAGQWYLLSIQIHHPRTFLNVLIPSLLAHWIFALLTPGVLWISARFPVGRGHWLYNIPAHIVGTIAFLLAWVGAHVALYPLADLSADPGAGPSWRLFRNLVFEHAFYALWMYGTIVALCQSWDYYWKFRERELRASRLEGELGREQLKALRMQLDPQFLFGTLDSISMLMHQDVEAADDAITHLSDLLRMSLDSMDEPEISLVREVEYLKTYLAIGQIQRRHPIHLETNLQPKSLDALVPAMILPAFVEGASGTKSSGSLAEQRVSVRSEIRDGTLWIEFVNGVSELSGLASGKPQPENAFAAACARLERLYGEAQRCTSEITSGGERRLTLEVPFKVEVHQHGAYQDRDQVHQSHAV